VVSHWPGPQREVAAAMLLQRRQVCFLVTTSRGPLADRIAPRSSAPLIHPGRKYEPPRFRKLGHVGGWIKSAARSSSTTTNPGEHGVGHLASPTASQFGADVERRGSRVRGFKVELGFDQSSTVPRPRSSGSRGYSCG